MLNRVEAIIFIDCMHSGISHGITNRKKDKLNTNLRDLLDVLDRLQTELELPEGGHVSRILGGGIEDEPLCRNAGEGPPCKHYGTYNKKTKVSCVAVSGVLAWD